MCAVYIPPGGSNAQPESDENKEFSDEYDTNTTDDDNINVVKDVVAPVNLLTN